MTTEVTQSPVDRRVPWIAKTIAADMHYDAHGSSYHTPKEGVLPETAMDARTMAGLDYRVSLEPVYGIQIGDDGARYQEIEKAYGVTRSSDQKVLGVVGDRYHPLQTKDQALFVDAMIDTAATKGVVMGEVKGGRRTFAALELDRRIMPDLDSEAISTWFVVINSFDGSTAFSGSVVPLRMACINGIVWMIEGLARTWKIRHTKSAEHRLDIAASQLGLVNTYLDRFESEVEILMATPMPKDAGVDLLEGLFPLRDDASDRTITAVENKRDGVLATWDGSENLENVRHTQWGFLNAVAEWDQWERGGVRLGKGDRADWNMQRIAGGRDAKLVDRARALIPR